MKTTLGTLLQPRLYAFIYGAEGMGKTRLAMTLSRQPGGMDVGYVTPEATGGTSLITSGFSPNIKYDVIPTKPGSGLPFDYAANAVRSMAADPTIKTIVFDGVTVTCGFAVEELSKGKGPKALGFDGWGVVLSGFRRIEHEMYSAFAEKGKSCIWTAWEAPPEYEPESAFSNNMVLKELGRPMLQGQAKRWLPGKVDIIARLTSDFQKDPKNPKGPRVWTGELQLNTRDNWLAKCRWSDTLPDPFPADLGKMLRMVEAKAAGLKIPPKVPAPIPPKK